MRKIPEIQISGSIMFYWNAAAAVSLPVAALGLQGTTAVTEALWPASSGVCLLALPRKGCRAPKQRARCTSVAGRHALCLLGTRATWPQPNCTVTLGPSGNVRAAPRWD